MEDQAIIELYFARSEDAVGETDRKYGAFCRRIALNILSLREDVEECVNERPVSLRAFLGAITRNLSVARWRAEYAQKRFNGMELMLSELNECLPARESTEAAADCAQLAETIAVWLRGLEPDDRTLFVRRYWYGDAVKALAKEYGAGENQMAQRMRRLRARLKTALEEGGFSV